MSVQKPSLLHDGRQFALGGGHNIIRVTDAQARKLPFVPAGSVTFAINSGESTATFLQNGGCRMSAVRVNTYIEAVTTGILRKLGSLSEVERARVTVGMYIVSFPANIDKSSPDCVHCHLDSSRYIMLSPRLRPSLSPRLSLSVGPAVCATVGPAVRAPVGPAVPAPFSPADQVVAGLQLHVYILLAGA
jgi:hypothetical protein